MTEERQAPRWLRRSRGQREAQRKGSRAVAQIVKLHDLGFSPASIAPRVAMGEVDVKKILDILGVENAEESIAESGGRGI
jgi:hypothetical protein